MRPPRPRRMGEVQVATGTGVADDLPVSLIEGAARWTLQQEEAEDAVLSIALITDAEIADLNERYLSHSGPTDVISFLLSDEGKAIVGDIYIGVEQADRQATEMLVSFEEELVRLAIHGTLHVLGYDHPDADRADSEMYRRQESLLTDFLASTGGLR